MHKTPTFISILHYIRLIWIKTAILCEQLVCIFVSAALLRSSIFTINKINTRKIKRERFGFFLNKEAARKFTHFTDLSMIHRVYNLGVSGGV